MDNKNFAIGVLSITSIILLVGLLVIHARPEPAYAIGMNAQGGDYLLITGQLQTSEELLYVIDGRSERMRIYRFDINRNQIQSPQAKRLDQLSGSVGSSEKPEKKEKDTRKRHRGRRR